MLKKSPFADLMVFPWERDEPLWRQEINRHLDEILEDTGLSEEKLETVLEVLQSYRILA